MTREPQGRPSSYTGLRASRIGGVAEWASLLVGPAFLLLAAWFVWGSHSRFMPNEPAAPIDRSRLSTEPRREKLGDPPTITIHGERRTCNDCHRLFTPSGHTPASLREHADVRLNHGINDRCRNCHSVENRNKLVLHDGTEIGFRESSTLCAKCHGPTFRDWERGAHGRTNGFWDSSRGTVRRLDCSECHDPHDPRYPAMEPIRPLPGPHTLRMGDEPEHPNHARE